MRRSFLPHREKPLFAAGTPILSRELSGSFFARNRPATPLVSFPPGFSTPPRIEKLCTSLLRVVARHPSSPFAGSDGSRRRWAISFRKFGEEVDSDCFLSFLSFPRSAPPPDPRVALFVDISYLASPPSRSFLCMAVRPRSISFPLPSLRSRRRWSLLAEEDDRTVALSPLSSPPFLTAFADSSSSLEPIVPATCSERRVFFCGRSRPRTCPFSPVRSPGACKPPKKKHPPHERSDPFSYVSLCL